VCVSKCTAGCCAGVGVLHATSVHPPLLSQGGGAVLGRKGMPYHSECRVYITCYLLLL
jgi:hypothetical protein